MHNLEKWRDDRPEETDGAAGVPVPEILEDESSGQATMPPKLTDTSQELIPVEPGVVHRLLVWLRVLNMAIGVSECRLVVGEGYNGNKPCGPFPHERPDHFRLLCRRALSDSAAVNTRSPRII